MFFEPQYKLSRLSCVPSPFNSFPGLFQDAICLARKLGISYICIDVICVIQDDPRDWFIEGRKLAKYAVSATFTFAAISSPNPKARLFGECSDVDALLLLASVRVGLFVGPRLDRPLDRWVRRCIKIR
jgi:hypothetical protein